MIFIDFGSIGFFAARHTEIPAHRSPLLHIHMYLIKENQINPRLYVYMCV